MDFECELTKFDVKTGYESLEFCRISFVGKETFFIREMVTINMLWQTHWQTMANTI